MFIRNIARQFGGSLYSNSIVSLVVNISTFKENSASFGSAVSMGQCKNSLINFNRFSANLALQAGTVYWFTAPKMAEPRGLADNKFTGNIARVYGQNVATDIVGINVTPSILIYNDYTPGSYPLNLKLFVSDFYNQVVKSENNKIMDVSIADVSCSFNFALSIVCIR